MQETIAKASGAAFGYITSGRRGIMPGYKFGQYADRVSKKVALLKGKEMAKFKVSKFRRRPYKKPKGTGKKRKAHNTRKSTKRIKNIVKRQLECDFNKSVFERNYHFIVDPRVEPGKQFVISQGNIEPGDFGSSGLNFNFRILDPARLLDAASVLYNGKSVAFGPQNGVGSGFFNSEKTSVNFHYASQTIHMTNITDVEYEFHMYEGVQKRSQGTSMKQAWDFALTKQAWVGTEPTSSDFGTTPTQNPGFKDNFNVKKQMKFKLKPGEKRTFYYKFSGCVDFKKYSSGSNSVYAHNNGFRELMFICYPTEALNFLIPNPSLPDTGTCYANRISLFNSKKRAIAFEFNEVYKVQQPDETVDTYEGNFRCLHNVVQAPEVGSEQIHKIVSVPNLYETTNGEY